MLPINIASDPYDLPPSSALKLGIGPFLLALPRNLTSYVRYHTAVDAANMFDCAQPISLVPMGTMPGKQNDPNETEERRERVRWIRLVHLTWRISVVDEENHPVRRLFDELGQAPTTGAIFNVVYHAAQMEAAIQELIDRFGLNADDVATLRDIIQRTIWKP